MPAVIPPPDPLAGTLPHMTAGKIKRRLIAGFGANTFSRLATTLTQILSVPVFLSHWGGRLYGEWIILNTIPTYVGLSDVGFGSVAGNEMTMLASADRLDEALTVFQSVWVLTTAVSALVGAALLGAIWFLPLNSWLNLSALSVRDVRLIMLLLSLAILLGMQENLFQQAFRCVGKYPMGTLAKSLVVLAAFAGTMVGVLLGMSPLGVTIVYVTANVFGVLALWLLLRRQVPWIRFGVRRAEMASIRRLASPAFSFMSFIVVNSLNLQGILVIIGHVMGPIAVVTFSTARTISRSAAQGMLLINNSVWPEMSAAFGVGDIGLARRLHRRCCQLSLLLCLGITGLAALFGNWIWRVWTIREVPTDRVLLFIMLAQMILSAFWFTSSVVPISVNKHQRIAKAMLGASVAALVLAWLLMAHTRAGLRGAALALTFADLATAWYVVHDSLKLVQDNLGDFTRSLFDISALRRLWAKPGLPTAS